MEYDNTYLSKEQDIEKTIEVIEVSDVETYEIDSDVAFPPLGEANEELKHQLLNGRELEDQHPITAITGLRDELDNIESLQTVYSDKRHQADYYLWEDENVLQESRVGYFVSACADINQIKICTSDDDIFGVTVDNAGFIGAQAEIVRDSKYGLVVTTGVVHVRCEQSVNIGDYVISNDHGCAQKNQNGYKVVGRHQIHDVEYAEIALVTPIGRMCEVTDNVEELNTRMDNAEENINIAQSKANEAYNIASSIDFQGFSQGVSDKVNEAYNKVDQVLENNKNINDQVQTAVEKSEEAKKAANDSLSNVNALIKDLEPISTWGIDDDYITVDVWDETDKDISKTYYAKDTKLYYYYYNGEWASVSELTMGASYLINYINNDVATKSDVETAETELGSYISEIRKSATEFQTFMSSVDKYSVGEYSQAYGLTREQAENILKVGTIYVPTDSHGETFVDESEPQQFTRGYHYEWDGYKWIETSNSVAFFSETPRPSGALQYWYIDSNNAPTGYEPYALYIWDGEWKRVNILAGNANNRVTSMIRQQADEIAIEVANKVSAASIITSINNSGSSVQLNGDHIILNGAATNGNGSFKVDENGHMIASGGKIANWKINSTSLRRVLYDTSDKQTYDCFIQASDTANNVFAIRYTEGDYAADYTQVETSDWTYAFAVNKYGVLTATKGTVGGWTIGPNAGYTGGIYSKTSTTYPYYQVGMKTMLAASTEAAFYVAKYTDKDTRTLMFYVNHEGKLVAQNASVIAGHAYQWSVYHDNSLSENALMGTLGYIAGSDGKNITHNIGIKSNSANSNGIILESTGNIRLSAHESIYLKTTHSNSSIELSTYHTTTQKYGGKIILKASNRAIYSSNYTGTGIFINTYSTADAYNKTDQEICVNSNGQLYIYNWNS